MSYLSPENWPFSLDFLPPNSYLVGGAVRDSLLNQSRDYLDLDFVLPNHAVETARSIAQYYQVGFVVLDKERQIARIVFPEGTIDFAQQEGDTIEIDLGRRDFTINAIAYNPHTQNIIDPYEGKKDLEQKLLRMIASKNLEDDPLRLLRAYRQAAQLNFSIEGNTLFTINSLAALIAQVSPERIQQELNYLLPNPRGNSWLIKAWQDGILKFWFPSATETSIQEINLIQPTINYFITPYSEFKQLTPHDYGLVKLASFVSNEPKQAQIELRNLKYSVNSIRTVIALVKYLPKLQALTQSMNLKEQYFFFLEIDNVFPLLALRAMALGVAESLIFPLIERYFNPDDQVAHPQPLVTGNDLIQHLKIAPSPKIGQLLTAIQIAHIEGKISTIPEALELAKFLLNTDN